MNSIVKLYRSTYRVQLITDFVITALGVLGLWMVGAFEKNSLFYIVIVALWITTTLVNTIRYIAVPLNFKRKAAANKVLNEAINSEKPVQSGLHFFYKNAAVFFDLWSIRTVEYKDIVSADIKFKRIVLKLNNGKKLKMPYYPSENPALMCAIFRAENENIAVYTDGRLISDSIDKMQKKNK